VIADSIASITGSEPSSIGVRCAVNVPIRCRRRCVRLQRGSSFGRFGSGETGQSLEEVIGHLSRSDQGAGRRNDLYRSSTTRGRHSTRTTLYRGLLPSILRRSETSYQLGRKAMGRSGVWAHSRRPPLCGEFGLTQDALRWMWSLWANHLASFFKGRRIRVSASG
jgi:hypothetical protein